MSPQQSLHDILAAAGDIKALKPRSLRIFCTALVAFASNADRRVRDSEAREQATYLALYKLKSAQVPPSVRRSRRRKPGAAVTALLKHQGRK
jgi:hypothetical protein